MQMWWYMNRHLDPPPFFLSLLPSARQVCPIGFERTTNNPPLPHPTAPIPPNSIKAPAPHASSTPPPSPPPSPPPQSPPTDSPSPSSSPSLLRHDPSRPPPATTAYASRPRFRNRSRRAWARPFRSGACRAGCCTASTRRNAGVGVLALGVGAGVGGVL